MVPRRLAALVAATLALGLSACGGADDEPSSEAKTVAGDGFEIELPKGWQRTSQQQKGVLHLRVLDGRAQVGALTVRRLDELPEGTTLAALFETTRRQILATVPGLSPADLDPARPVSLDGTPTRGYVARATFDGREGVVRGLVTLRGGEAYTTVFAIDARHAARRIDQYRSILRSWRWTRDGVKPKRKPDEASASDDAARLAQGPPVAGSGYDFNLPKGWRRVRSQPPPGLKRPQGYRPPDLLVSGGSVDGIPVTTAVVVEPAGARDLDGFLEDEGVRYFNAGDPPTETVLDGLPAVAASSERTGIRDVRLGTETWAAVRDGKAYVVDFSAPRERFLKVHRAFRAAMASWRWQ